MVAIDRIAPLEELEAWANEEELKSVETISATARRAERLAWRQMLRKVANQSIEIIYNNQGAPQLRHAILKDGVSYEYVSVSHCRDRVAVMLSNHPCGIDIEQLAREFSRISSRYITPEERALCESGEFEAVAWCAKEALYKLAQVEGLDFRRDIIIEAIDLAQGTIVGRAGELSQVTMQILRPDGEHIAVATL